MILWGIPNKVLKLGWTGEHKATKIIFTIDPTWITEYGSGEFKVRVLRPGETEAYNATNVTVDLATYRLTMEVTDIELSYVGTGYMQVVYLANNEIVKKSAIYEFKVVKAIDGNVVDPPSNTSNFYTKTEIDNIFADYGIPLTAAQITELQGLLE